MLVAVLLTAGCGVDSEQVRICRKIIAALEDDPERITVVRVAPHPNTVNGVIIDYVIADDGAPGRPTGGANDAGLADALDRAHWVSCRFEGRGLGLGFGPQTVVEVASDRVGRLSGVDLEMLRIWLRLTRPKPGATQAG